MPRCVGVRLRRHANADVTHYPGGVTTALYRRYRPDTFDQVIGQEHVTEPLKAALRANRVTHAYLFSGPRGCGKTTSARILARCLNCAQGPTDKPCGQCASCRELATGGPGSLDVVEIDAASHGGVDDARDLRERATFAPVRDRYKIFIIDEAHMVTNQGFNALLKLVEEPPEHVKFVFATTEPERVIGTIRSRTHHYPFRLVPPDVLGPYLGGLCREEGVRVTEGVLSLVMRAGGGSVRDTLSVLDQLMAGAIHGEVTYQTAVALLGYTDSALLDQSVDALAGGDGAAAFRVVERMVESGHDPRRFVEDLLQRLRDLLIIAVAGDGARDVLADTPSDQFERMQRQAQNWGPHGLSRAADLTDEALRAMTGATSPRLQLELLMGRILVPAPEVGHAPVQGTVGMAGGGAPREAQPSPSSQSSGGRFGAREAREALARKKQERAEATATPAAVSSTPVAPAHSRPAWGGGPDWSSPAPTPTAPEEASAGPEGRAPKRGGTASEPVRPQATAQSAEPVRQSPPESGGAPAPRGPEPPAEQGDETGVPPARSAGRDADMLRGRWNEVLEHLKSISRVAWSLVGVNAQLGAVDGSTVVLLFPVDAMVAAFARGPRATEVEEAIREVTGLSLAVIAQVGQASGGTATTGPSAQASRAGNQPRPPQADAWVSEPPPFDRAAAEAAHEEPHAPHAQPWPQPARTPEGEQTHPATEEPRDTGWPQPAAVQPIQRVTADAEPEAASSREERRGPGALPARAIRALADAPAGDAHPAPAPSSERKHSFTVFRYPGDPQEGEPLAPVSVEDASNRPPAFDDTPIETAPRAPITPTGWDDPIVIPGGAPVSFDDPGGEPPSAEAATVGAGEATPDDAATSAPAWLASAPVCAAPAGPVASGQPDGATERADALDAPLRGRAAAEAALRARERSDGEAADVRTHAAEDDSASIDDENIETSQTIGLAAVLEILGGRVIEEKMTEGGY